MRAFFYKRCYLLTFMFVRLFPKLATIIDLLEGSLYGLDLLKLNSVTTKLLTRVDSLEKVRKIRPYVRNEAQIVQADSKTKEEKHFNMLWPCSKMHSIHIPQSFPHTTP